ncbi:MAG: hypothetical protein [Caudoviricetes sp.]|nr:MAG: hypothetical protein [Caudoviricetes sp.]
MTDITELAQSLKASAEKATQGNWRAFQYHDGRCGIGGGHNDEIMVCEHISKERPHDAMFIALANPANIIALVEALELKEQQRANWFQMAQKLGEDLDAAEKRIAELEDAEKKPCAANVTLDARAELAERQLESRTVTVKLSKDHVDDADLFGWGVIVVPLEALKEACADAGVTCEGPQDFKRIIDREAPPEWAIEEGQARNIIPLYRHAELAPVVPEEWTIADAVKFCKETGRQDAGAAMDAWNACRAAMLNQK